LVDNVSPPSPGFNLDQLLTLIHSKNLSNGLEIHHQIAAQALSGLAVTGATGRHRQVVLSGDLQNEADVVNRCWPYDGRRPVAYESAEIARNGSQRVRRRRD
jgi:hypothetical protein